MVSPLFKFGTFDFSEDVEDCDEGLNTRLTVQVVPKRHGAIIADVPTLEPRIISFRGAILKSGPTALVDARARRLLMSKSFNAGRQRLQIYDDLYNFAFKNSFAWSYINGSPLAAIAFTVQFVCDDPFLYKISGPITQFYALTSPPDLISIPNNGDAFVFPRVQLIANMGGPLTPPIKLTHSYINPLGQTITRVFQYNGVVAAGTILDVDMANFSVLNNGVADLPNFAGSFLWLNSGANTYYYEGSPATFAITFAERFA